MTEKVSIIIPTKNEEKNIERCLKSLQKQSYSPLEILVVDNHSTDRTREISKKLGARVFTAGPERSSQRNFGASQAKGHFLFFVDADMEVTKNVLRETPALFKKEERIKAIIVPEISVGKNYWARVRILERNCYLGEATIEAPRIFEKKTFLKAGGFDEDLVAAEDWDLAERVKPLGKIGRIRAKIIHHEDKLSLLVHLRKKYYYAKNIHLYAKKYPEKFQTQKGRARIKIFLRNWEKLMADPIPGLGVIILKFLEYLVFLFAKIR